MKTFYWSDFADKSKKIAVHCNTEKRKQMFFEELERRGFTWNDGVSYLNFSCDKPNICFDNSGMFATKEFYEEKGYTIFEWGDFLPEEQRPVFNWEEFENLSIEQVVYIQGEDEYRNFKKKMKKNMPEYNIDFLRRNNSNGHDFGCYSNKGDYMNLCEAIERDLKIYIWGDYMEEDPAPEKKTNKKESVNHPSHYNVGSIEAITVIEDWKLGFNLGNTIKYISRCGHKGSAIEDLEKAQWYLNREIQNMKEKNNGI